MEVTAEKKNWGLTHEKVAIAPIVLKTTDTNPNTGEEEEKVFGTFEGRSGWKVTGGGSDAQNTMQFAWEMKNDAENGSEYK